MVWRRHGFCRLGMGCKYGQYIGVNGRYGSIYGGVYGVLGAYNTYMDMV